MEHQSCELVHCARVTANVSATFKCSVNTQMEDMRFGCCGLIAQRCCSRRVRVRWDFEQDGRRR